MRPTHPQLFQQPSMSQKITSKNLAYDDSLPPFLARLRNQHASAAAEPDPILASRRRAAKPRSASEEAEDGPLVVDEEGVVVSGVTVGKDGVVTEDKAGEGEGDGAVAEREKEREKEKKTGQGAAIGGGRKRKVGKVVGGDDKDEAEDEDGAKAAKKEDRSRELAKGSKKKAKKIKLSFGDEEGD